VTRHLEQLSAAIDRGVREVIARGFSDPRIAGLITVTGVRVLPDLSQAFVSISVLPAEKQDLTIHGLESAATFIRREVGDLINARTMPRLTFKLDTTLKKQAAVLRELDRVREEMEQSQAQTAETEQPPTAPPTTPPQDAQT
jgi:ribosome-binding factor A